MRKLLSTLALLSSVAFTSAAYADTFNFTAIGMGGSVLGSGAFDTTANGGGSYTIVGISGTGITGLIAPGGYLGNDNLLFPTGTSLVDTNGFAFFDVMGNTGFKVNIHSVGAGVYAGTFIDSDGFGQTLPVTFRITAGPILNPVIPEPSSLLLLGTGIAGMGGVIRRRFKG